MGATLPAIARWIEASPRGVAWLGFFYGGNTAGAVVGSLLAGYYLLRVHDIAVATYVAVALNVVVAVVALAVAARAPHEAAPIGTRRAEPGAGPMGGLSGHRALGVDGARVRGAVDAHAVAALWRDGLHLLADPRGIPGRPRHWQQPGFGAGARSDAPARRAGVVPARRSRAAMAWTSYILTDSLPFWPINPSLTPDPWFQFQLDLTRCLFARAAGGHPLGRELSAGAGVGGGEGPRSGAPGRRRLRRQHARCDRRRRSAPSLLLVVWLGTQRSQQVLIVLSALSGLVLMWREHGGDALVRRRRRGRRRCWRSPSIRFPACSSPTAATCPARWASPR